jgi:MFS family permease
MSRIKPSFAGWRMVTIAHLAQNFAVGMTTGAYGTALPSLRAELGASRALASSAIGLMLLSMGLLAPVVGSLLRRFSIRQSMSAGAILNAIGYFVLGVAGSFPVILCTFAFLIGPGACLLGLLPASTLASRWFIRDRGKALGIVNMPLFLLIIPPLAARLVIHGGPHLLFITMSITHLSFLLVIRVIVERPADIGQVARGSTESRDVAESQVTSAIRLIDLTKDFRFWLISLGVGILTGASTVFVTHAVLLAGGKGFDLANASMLLSAFGAGSLVGSVGFGWLSDRIGPFAALILNATIQIVLWSGLAVCDSLPLLLACSAAIGACLGAGVALHAAGINVLYGSMNFSRAMGLSYFVKIPFLLVPAPLVGYLVDRSGGYYASMVLIVASLACAALIFCVLRGRRSPPLGLIGS